MDQGVKSFVAWGVSGSGRGPGHRDRLRGPGPNETRRDAVVLAVTMRPTRLDPTSPILGETSPRVPKLAGIDDALGGRVAQAVPEGRDLQAEHWHAQLAARLFGRDAPGPSVGRYQLLERLGGGASGEVWMAAAPQLDRRVAIKLLHDTMSPQDARTAMVREAKSLAKLSHPNVVPVFDAGVHQGRVFVALELVEGSTLRQWLGTRRTWREVVEVFTQAARGLQAAHTAGIVHRDFKPENVLIGNDGRVRVSDFGIARVAGTDDDTTVAETATSTAGIGTPAYMAPEQFLGGRIDARSDQFGYCVALAEALYGERPFDGRDHAGLAANVTAGRQRPRPRPPMIDVPRWLGGLVTRGLSTDPARRFADMASLLAVLEQPTRGRTRRWLGIAAVGLATLGLLRQRVDAANAGCEHGSDRLAAVWNASAARRIREAFAASGSSHAEERADRLVFEFDRFGEAWRAAHDAACTATVDDGTRIAQQYCLHTRLLELESMATAFARADAQMVEHTAIGGSAGRAPGECLYVVPAADAPAHDPEQDLELRAAIATARTYGDVGKLVEGLAAARDATRRARDLGLRSLEAEALLVTAELQNPLLGSVDEVDPAATMHAAVLAAESSRRPDLIALALVASMESDLAQGDYVRAKLSQQRARVAAAAMGDPPELVGRIELCLAEIMMMERDGDAAGLLERARAQFERSGPASRRWLAQAHNLIGETEFRRGDYEAARPHYARALAIVTEDLRPHHIMVANASGNLAETYFVVGDFATANRYFGDALAIRREVFGADSVWVSHTLGHLADVAWERGDASQALATYAEALEYQTQRPDPVHAPATISNMQRDLQTGLQQGWMRNGMALALLDLGRHDEALAQAEWIDEPQLPEDQHHPDLLGRIDLRAVVLSAMGRHDEALVAFEEALLRLEQTYGPDARAIGFVLVGLGRALLQRGEVARGVAALQRALTIFAPTPRAYPRVQASARFALGRAWLAAPTLAERGREQIRIAIAALADSEGVARRERDEMIAWLEAAR